jgi:hypothetical protein
MEQTFRNVEHCEELSIVLLNFVPSGNILPILINSSYNLFAESKQFV